MKGGVISTNKARSWGGLSATKMKQHMSWRLDKFGFNRHGWIDRFF
jgi:hypothetical protein